MYCTAWYHSSTPAQQAVGTVAQAVYPRSVRGRKQLALPPVDPALLHHPGPGTRTLHRHCQQGWGALRTEVGCTGWLSPNQQPTSDLRQLPAGSGGRRRDTWKPARSRRRWSPPWRRSLSAGPHPPVSKSPAPPVALCAPHCLKERFQGGAGGRRVSMFKGGCGTEWQALEDRQRWAGPGAPAVRQPDAHGPGHDGGSCRLAAAVAP
jgi:hypothetical protein